MIVHQRSRSVYSQSASRASSMQGRREKFSEGKILCTSHNALLPMGYMYIYMYILYRRLCELLRVFGDLSRLKSEL